MKQIFFCILFILALFIVCGCITSEKINDTNSISNKLVQKDINYLQQSKQPRTDLNSHQKIKNPDKNNQNKPANNQVNPDTNVLDSSSVYISTKTVSQLLDEQAGSTLLGRPTNTSITLNMIATQGMEGYFEYGVSPGNYTQTTSPVISGSGEPIEIVISNLAPNSKYYYRAHYKKLGETQFKQGIESSFTTQRPVGTSFTFDIQADPHLDGHSESNVYTLSLQNEKSDAADFIIDLGDDFMTEKFAKNQDEVNRRYLALRSYYDLVGNSTPLFLANGNHEGEFGWLFAAQDKNNDAYWAIEARKEYYPNPIPNTFYSGSTTLDPLVGLHENYYSWTWGDALFVILDPYTYSTEFRKQTGDMWDSTIGDAQYQWLTNTLQTSTAKYKFVFMHHMLGEFRGMTTWADKYEWGGKNSDGTWGFNTNRPTWQKTIHQLFVDTNVTIFFQGHDHLFSKEVLDGVIYQEIAQPSTSHGDPAPGTEGMYLGEVLNSPGYMRIQVTPQVVTAEYVKTYSPGNGINKEVAYSYEIR